MLEEESKCEAFLNMLSDDLPASASERALPCQEAGKCEAFLGMPADDLPASASERALPEEEGKCEAFFQLIKSLTSVCYRASEAEDEQLQRLLRELPGAGVAVVDLDAYDDFQKLPIQPRETLLLAGSRETLLLAKGTSMATIGYGALVEDVSDGMPGADLLVEGFEEVDVQLLDRIMKRAQGLPWITVVTRRCILREITLGDLDDLFALYAQPGITDYTEPLYEREAEEQYTRDYITKMYRFYGYGMWLVFSRESGELIGRAGFSHQDLGDEIVLEMGYIIGVPWQRQGYATEICQKLIEFARANLSSFGTLNCFIEPGNVASHGLAKKLGFLRCGTVDIKKKEMVWYEKEL